MDSTSTSTTENPVSGETSWLQELDWTNLSAMWFHFWDIVLILFGLGAILGIHRNRQFLPLAKRVVYYAVVMAAIINSISNICAREVLLCRLTTAIPVWIAFHNISFGCRSGAEVLHAMYAFTQLRLFPWRLASWTCIVAPLVVFSFPVGALCWVSYEYLQDFEEQFKKGRGDLCYLPPDATSEKHAHIVSFFVCLYELLGVIGFLFKPIGEMERQAKDLKRTSEVRSSTFETRTVVLRECKRCIWSSALSAVTFAVMGLFDLAVLFNKRPPYEFQLYFAAANLSCFASMSLVVLGNPYIAEDTYLWRPALYCLQRIKSHLFVVRRPGQASSTRPQAPAPQPPLQMLQLQQQIPLQPLLPLQPGNV